MDITDIMQQTKKILLKQQGHHHPTVIVESEKDIYLVMLDFLPDTTLEKQKLLFSIGRDMAMEHDIEAKEVTQLVWICEAWFSIVKPEEFDTAPSPSKDPRKQEGLIVLMLTLEDKTLVQDAQAIEIIRHGDTFDLLLLPKPDMGGTHSSLLTSCLAGICSAALSEYEFDALLKKYQ